MARKFIYDGREFPDPDPNLTPDEVRQSMTQFFPELSNAEVVEAKQGEDTVYELKRRVGVKGGEPVRDCHLCTHLKEKGVPHYGQFLGECEFKLQPATCGKFSPVPECRYCEHLKDIGGPLNGRYVGSCEFSLAPLTCGKYELAACFDDPREQMAEEVSITGPDGQPVKDTADFLKKLQGGVFYIPQNRK